MAVELTVPQLGESITEAVVGKWNKKVGEAIKADEAVVSLETDKVTVDVPAPAGGSLERITRQEGEKVRVGEVLGTIAAGQPAPSATVAAAPPAAPVPAAQPAAAAAQPVATAAQPVATPAGPTPAVAAPREEEAAPGAREAPITPVARRVAQDNGLDPSQLKGSGPGGRIVKDDVLGQIGRDREPVPEPKPTSPPTPSGPRPNAAREERVKMTPLRRRVAERLLAAQSHAAILTTFNEVEMTAVLHLRKTYGEKFLAKHGVKLGFMSFFVRATLEALKAFPQINAEIDGEDVVFKRYYDIGVAVSGSRGLVVPVLRDADKMSMAELERQIGEYGNKARADKLTLADLTGGTFTISNGGIFGSMLSTPILNPPQTGILGMHNIQERAVVRDGQIVARSMMYLALSYDHRLVDGREAVQFLVRIKDILEDPQRLIFDL